jgi:hypothetical protein
MRIVSRKQRRNFAFWSLLFTLVLFTYQTAAAGQAGPQTAETPPHVPEFESAQLESSTASVELDNAQASVTIAGLKAVLLVGPIDGDNGQWTVAEKNNMEKAARELEANGVTVYRFYTPDNQWDQIVAAARGAHFFFYRGHGVYWSDLPNPTVGGLALKDRFISSEDIRRDLRLAANAIVMVYGCFTAGSSSLAGDVISSSEAQRRIAQYSDPFFDAGAGGYFANWYGDAFQQFVRYLFQGKTQGKAYENFFDYNPNTVERFTHPNHANLSMWMDHDVSGGANQYNFAFAGKASKTLQDLFTRNNTHAYRVMLPFVRNR